MASELCCCSEVRGYVVRGVSKLRLYSVRHLMNRTLETPHIQQCVHIFRPVVPVGITAVSANRSDARNGNFHSKKRVEISTTARTIQRRGETC